VGQRPRLRRDGGDPAPIIHHSVGCTKIKKPARVDPEEMLLNGGLGRSDSLQLNGSIGCKDEQRDTTLGRFHDGGKEVTCGAP